MAAPRYVQRIARLPRLIARIATEPDGLLLSQLAAEEGADVDELREDLLAYYTADADRWMLGLSRPTVLEFLAADGSDTDEPGGAELVRVVDPEAVGEIGVEHLAAHELAFVYTAALSLQEAEPDEDLAAAIDVLAETMFGSAAESSAAASDHQLLALLRTAIEEQRQVDLVYSRAWYMGITTRRVDPYRLTRTRRGWELDAGPADAGGRLRTFLLSNVRSATPTEEGFEFPAELDPLLRAQRTVSVVRVRLPHVAHWAADMYAETVDVVEQDEDTFTADLALLEPVVERVGLIMLAGGGQTRVLDPAALVSSGPMVARELHAHHSRHLGEDGRTS